MATLTSPISALNSTNPQDVDIQQQSVIVALRSQVNTIQSEVGVINSGLQGIANLIRNDSLLEQTRLLEEQKREKLFTERRIREGKESQIEQTIDASIQRPIDRLTPKVTSSFDGLSKAFGSLFTGFLGPKILGFITNSVKLGVGALSKVKSLIGKSFQFIGKSFSALGNGFKNIIGKIGGLTKKINDIILKLAKSPVKAISDFFKGLGRGGAAAAGTGAARTAVSTGGSFFDDILRGIGGAVRRVGGPLIGGGAMAGLDIASGERPDRAAAGAFGGTLASMVAFAATSPIPIPGTGVAAAALAYEPGSDVFKKGYDALTTGNFNFNINPSSFFTDVKSKVDMGINSVSNFFGLSDNNKPEQNPKPTPSSPPSSQPSSEVQIPPDPVNPISVPVISGSPEQNQQSQANIESPPKAPPVGATPPPPPDVIMASTVSQDQSRSQGRSRSGPMTDVPLLPSANIDNFYTLYSQTHYNVVM